MARIFNTNTADITEDLWLRRLRLTGSDFPGGDNIDLRQEFHNILNGGPGIGPKGHYVLLRHNYTDKPTKDFDLVNKEATGPHPFEFVDQFILCYRARPWLSPYNEQVIPPGLINLDTYVYYFEYNIEIGVNDFIFEYGVIAGQSLDKNELPTPIERYNIRMIDPRRADDGRIEYYRIVGELDLGHHI